MQSRPVAIAPASIQTLPEHTSPMPYNCQPCVRRKIKCDRSIPSCSSCLKGKFDCFYKAPPPPRKRKRPESEDVHERLARYERMLQDNGLLSITEARSPSSKENTERVHKSSPLRQSQLDITQTGKLVTEEGKSRYIDSRVWLDVAEVSMQELSDNEGDDQPAHMGTNLWLGDPLSGALLGVSQSLIGYHPCHQDAMKLWTIYVQNVETLCKVLHIPTTTAMLEVVSQEPNIASRSQDCLLFAIYHFAVYSISDDHCLREFAEPRSVLMSKYQHATRQALINASWLKTTELPVLQAFVLFLIAMRPQTDPHTFWIWTGVAVRIAQRMGLHRDGESLGLPPFDVQMRRRLFWQLLPLDGYAGQVSGTGISITPGDWDTKQPLNVNDDQIYPGMRQRPEEQKGASEMMFCLTKAKLSEFYTRTAVKMNTVGAKGPPHDNTELEKLIDKLESDIETRYLRYCDIINPVHLLTLGIVRSAVNMVRLRSRMPSLASQDIDDNQRRELCALAQKILDTDNALYDNPNLRKFQWHIKTFFVWDAMICVLTSLSKSGLLSLPEQDAIWGKIAVTYKNHPEILEEKGRLHVAAGKVTLKAWIANPPSNSTPEPCFISTLRSRRKNRAPGRTSKPDDITKHEETVEYRYSLDTLFDSPDGVDLYFNGCLNYGAAEWMFWDQL
ncbi:putative C6 transcription factor [Aspergillus alliaceus]|uniref:putative C6 transcription factor n=1 Tax=Petromyces alliaceus TaxID=209559 RepID=UPI0012A42ECF|nr:fungal-specific transcription factor domain-containing protein [Aspergillus alliaceus]KAB8236675.1 fungal-specific transcription factor domain-containing protein [Aspergillus alliaceus]